MITRSMPLRLDDRVEVGEAAQPGQVGGADVVDVVVDDADRDEPELGVVAELLDDLAGDDAGAEDQRALAQVGGAVQAGADDRAGDAAEGSDAGDGEEGQGDAVADPRIDAATPKRGQVISMRATKPRGISVTAEAQLASWSLR